MHGKTSPIFHNSSGLFRGLPNPFNATRYHSLVVERDSLPDCLEITAWTEDGEIMGIRHKTLAIEGVQFHPESILTEHGHQLLANFLETMRRNQVRLCAKRACNVNDMMKPQEALAHIIDHREIAHDEMLSLMRQVMRGELSPTLIAAIMTGLRMKERNHR